MIDEKMLSITEGEVYEKAYALPNYRIIKYNNIHNRRCAIYFSGSSIYYPNTEEALDDMINRDYYEWGNSNIKNVEKAIYIRDVSKQFYVVGINNNINNIDALIKWLKEETKEYDIVTVGASAGGYMAALAAALLNAKECFCFSAYFSLRIIDQNIWYLIDKYKYDLEKNKYYEIVEYIKKAKKTKFFYVFPGLSKDIICNDCYQNKLVSNLDNVYTFMMKEKKTWRMYEKGIIKCLYK